MARSGDWVTPRLNGSPWFEKPPLLYWMTAAANKLGLRDEWAARLPVALLSLAFLAFFYGILEREFSDRIAMMATAILGSSAGWIAYSYSGVTDLPMAATFNAAMLIALFDTRHRRAAGWTAGAMLGLAILAKAFLPVVLFFPVWLIARGKRLAILAGAVLVAAPWHLLVWLRNGSAFWNVYFWQQQVSRVSSTAIGHVQPFWFYVPVLLLGLFPWTPLFGLLARGKTYDDVRVSSLGIWLILALVFFSASVNKLPGYLLPLLPAIAVVFAMAIDKAPLKQWWLGGPAACLMLLPTVAAALPQAFLAGFTHTHWRLHVWAGLAFLPLAAAVWWLGFRKQTELAVLAAALAAAIGAAYLKAAALPVLDREVAVRQFWRANAPKIQASCLDPGLRRSAAYALDYYAQRELPDCGTQSWQVVSGPTGLALSRGGH